MVRICPVRALFNNKVKSNFHQFTQKWADDIKYRPHY